MKTTFIKTILWAVALALGTGLAANAQTSDYYSQLAKENARRIRAEQIEAQRNAAALAEINAAKARRAEQARIQDQRDAEEARRINNANRGIAD